MDNDDEELIRILRMRNLERLLHADDRDDLAAQNDDLFVLNRLDIRRLDVDRTVNGAKWNRIHLVLHLNEHCLNDRKGKRQLDLEDGALIDVGLNVNMTRKGLNLAADNVHADAASGNIGNLLRSREARQEDEADRIRIVETICLLLRNHALLDRLAADLARINARAVIRDHDDDVVPLMPRDETDFTDARLSLFLACIRALNAVVERVAQEVHDRIADLVDNGTIQLGLLTLDREVDLLAEFLGYVAHHSGEAVEHRTDRDHADLHNNILQIARHTVHLLKRLHEIAHAMCLADLLEADFIDNQLTHKVHERIELLDVHADTLALMLLLRRSSRGRLRRILLLRRSRRLCCRCGRSLCCRRRCSILAELVGIELLHGNIFNFGNGINGILHRLNIVFRSNNHIKAELKLLLLKVFRCRNTLDHVADFVQRMHNHNGAGCLEDTGLHQRDLHMIDVQASLFCLFHDIQVDLIKIKSGVSLGSFSLRLRSCCSGGCRSRCRCAFGNRAELSHEIRDIHNVFRLSVADAVDHLLERIQALEQGVHDVLVELQLLFADKIQNILHLMRQFCNLGIPHRCRHALQCVCVAEYVIDRADFFHVLLETQQSFIQRLQMFVRLIQEHVHILVIH